MKKEALVYEGKRTLVSILGSCMYAVGVNLFVVPAGLYSGGVMGLCQIIRTLLVDVAGVNFGNFDFAGVIYYLFNIPLFILAYTRMGRKFLIKTVIAVTAMSVALSAIPTAVIVSDAMAACVVGGIISGAGVGLVLRMGSCGGGMDIVGMIMTQWKRDFSVGKINLLVNLALYGTCLFLFDVEIVVYSIIYAAAYSLAMDKVHIQNINVEATIITKADTKELEEAIFDDLYRGITKWSALGAYTHDESHILYVLLSKYEVNRLKALVRKCDPNAFIVINEGVSVQGNFLKKL